MSSNPVNVNSPMEKSSSAHISGHLDRNAMEPQAAPGSRDASGGMNSHASSKETATTPMTGNRHPIVSDNEEQPLNKKQKVEHFSNVSQAEQQQQHQQQQPSTMEQILAKLSPQGHAASEKSAINDNLLSKLSKQQALLEKQQQQLLSNETSVAGGGRPPAAFPSLTSATDTLATSASMDGNQMGPAEMLRLQQELLAANSRIAVQEQELAQNRVIKHTMDQAMGTPSEADFGAGREVTEQTISNLQNAFNASTRPFNHNQRQDNWVPSDDARSDISDALSAGAYNRSRGIWGNNSTQPAAFAMNGGEKNYRDPGPPEQGRNWNNRTANHGFAHSQRVLSGPSHPTYAVSDGRYAGDHAPYMQGNAPRRSFTQVNRGGSCFPPQNSPWGTFSADPAAMPPRTTGTPHIGGYQQVFHAAAPYHPRPIGTPLSPTAAEFTSAHSNASSWAPSANTNQSQTYVSPLEPMNYRRLLDKNVTCDWKYIVDKIVCSNDQQASIFLQQKLKVGTAEQKFDIIDAITNQAYPLMINRFGNFLIQRCFEHGTPDQVIAIANSIRGNTLSLSMDPFGCHVVQKAFDCVPEENKAIMVHELLRRIPETVIHRYACHVWQKLFELRWSNEPPQIMVKVNEALRGMWHEVALGETGSLVVQNIFENCVEDEKRQAIEEVLAKIDLLSHGQFGNWCIQHICEHGAPHDKSRAIEHILVWATDYSMDQFASKVVEKCLKIGGPEFLDRYLGRVCTGRADRPRMPLIDIAGDQYGNYLIQWILVNASPHQREVVATHIRKHMVSLRGSKFGSRVALLCCNPSHVTRPGPGAGVQVNRFGPPSEERFSVNNHSGGRFNRGGHWNSANYVSYR